MRDAIQSDKVERCRADENGDLPDHTVGLDQVKKDPNQ
jgi:hypothetical protein